MRKLNSRPTLWVWIPPCSLTKNKKQTSWTSMNLWGTGPKMKNKLHLQNKKLCCRKESRRLSTIWRKRKDYERTWALPKKRPQYQLRRQLLNLSLAWALCLQGITSSKIVAWIDRLLRSSYKMNKQAIWKTMKRLPPQAPKQISLTRHPLCRRIADKKTLPRNKKCKNWDAYVQRQNKQKLIKSKELKNNSNMTKALGYNLNRLRCSQYRVK